MYSTSSYYLEIIIICGYDIDGIKNNTIFIPTYYIGHRVTILPVFNGIVPFLSSCPVIQTRLKKGTFSSVFNQ